MGLRETRYQIHHTMSPLAPAHRTLTSSSLMPGRSSYLLQAARSTTAVPVSAPLPPTNQDGAFLLKRAGGTAPPQPGQPPKSSSAPQLATAAVVIHSHHTRSQGTDTPYERRPTVLAKRAKPILAYILASAPLASLSRQPSIFPTIVNRLRPSLPIHLRRSLFGPFHSLPSPDSPFFCPSIVYSYFVTRHTLASLRTTITKPKQTS